METLEAARPVTSTSDAEVELGAERPLFLLRTLETRGELGILRSCAAPPLDAARSL
jgi:hypothetical protein